MLACIVFGFGQAFAESEEVQPLNDARPLWEAGVGGFAGSVPDYPAAGQNTVHAFALPTWSIAATSCVWVAKRTGGR